MAFEDKNFYKHTAIPVQLSVEDDPKIIKGVEIIVLSQQNYTSQKWQALPEKDLSEKEMIARIPKDSPFVGAISCKKCHEVNYRNWLKTKHAKASQTIVASPKYAQEECLMCHSTGYGKMGEYATVEEIPFYLQGVQCETCHGEGKRTSGKRKDREKSDSWRSAEIATPKTRVPPLITWPTLKRSAAKSPNENVVKYLES